jgi:hypothetical protein
MDYLIATIVYVASLFGIIASIGGMLQWDQKDKAYIRVCYLATAFFLFTFWLGGSMLSALN